MIANDRELQTTLERIAWFQQQVASTQDRDQSRELPRGGFRLPGRDRPHAG